MTAAVYSVIRHEGTWRVQVNAHHYGHFPSREAATKIAIETAGLAGRFNAEGAVVVVVEPDDSTRVIWTYGKDAVPAPGFE